MTEPRLETFVAVPRDLSKQLQGIVTSLCVVTGVLLGIPELKFCWPILTVYFTLFICASYLSLRQWHRNYNLAMVPIYYVALCMTDGVWGTIFTWHAVVNAFIHSVTIIIDNNPRWRKTPCVIVTTAIIGECTTSMVAGQLSMSIMDFVVQFTDSSLDDFSYLLRIIIQAGTAIVLIALFYALINMRMRASFGTVPFDKEARQRKWVWEEVGIFYESVERERGGGLTGNIKTEDK